MSKNEMFSGAFLTFTSSGNIKLTRKQLFDMTESVSEVVAEMVEMASKEVEQNRDMSLNHESVCKTKQEPLKNGESDIVESENKDLPVRRSTRIKRLVMKPGTADNKAAPKQNKNKPAEIKTKLTNPNPVVQLEHIKIDLGLNKSFNQLTNLKNDVDSIKNEVNKNQRAVRKSQRNEQSKLEKEDNKSEKSKGKRKVVPQKKKQSSDNSIEKIIDDVVNAALATENYDKVNSHLPNISESSLNSTDDTASESQVPDIASNSSTLNINSQEKPSENILKPVKLKSRWCRSSELEGVLNSEQDLVPMEQVAVLSQIDVADSPIIDSHVADPHITELPITDVHNTEPPIPDSYITEPPMTDSHITEPLIADTHITEPPIVDPYITEPPIADPHITEPPIAADPHIAEPPTTDQHIDEPPIADPHITDLPTADPPIESESTPPSDTPLKEIQSTDNPVAEKPNYIHIDENIYHFERRKSKSKKQVRRMLCDCTLTKEDQENGIMGCKDECLNRLLMIECGYRCPVGNACSNRRFQKKEHAKCEVFKTEDKGWGLRGIEDLTSGDFLMEFVGEILNHKEYRQRVKLYAKEKNVHCYFMALKTDEILDATIKGNFARFINHSCDPNCETQKWTVNGELRVGVFVRRFIPVGEEFTLDYQFQRYGREAQRCHCGAAKCSGFIGGNKQISIDAYGGARSGSAKKKKGADDKKRDWEDMALEEEIQKLNSVKGLRNRQETLNFARLMVRADDSQTRHKLLDIILKTEEQACLRLFLDYHGLTLMWSWMTDTVDLNLKAKILKILSILPISNRTMLLDSKIMNVVEKWVKDYGKKTVADSIIITTESPDENQERLIKKIKLSDFSDSETDSTGSLNPSETISETSLNTENNPKDKMSPQESSSTESVAENAPVEDSQNPESDSKKIDPLNNVKESISSLGVELLNTWKSLKEVFRIPRLEQQKRKEDELRADHSLHVCAKTEEKPEVEVTGDHIQVLISGKTPSFSDNLRTFGEYDNPSGGYKMDDRSLNISPVSKSKKRNMRLKLLEEAAQRKLKEDSDSSLEASPLLPSASPQSSNRPGLLPIPYMNQTPVNYPSVPHLEQSQTLMPPQVVYPPVQMPFHDSGASPMLTQPTPQPLGNYPLPSTLQDASMDPSAMTYLPNQPPTATSYPVDPSQYANQNQAFYYMQQQQMDPQSVFQVPGMENVGQPASLSMQAFPQPSPSSLSCQQALELSTLSLPAQLLAALQEQAASQLAVQAPALDPHETAIAEETSPSAEDKPKSVRLSKNWRSVTDDEGNVYYYHSVTRQTQWDPPSQDQIDEDSEDEEEDSESEESDSEDTPTYDEPKISSRHSKRKAKKRKTTKAAADTSVSFTVRPEVAKKIKELFRTKISSYIVHCLNGYRRPECKVGRITNNEDFKYLARKLTHYVMTKEMKQCKNVEDLDCNDTVTHKAKDFIKKYMSKYGPKYSRKEKYSPTEVKMEKE